MKYIKYTPLYATERIETIPQAFQNMLSARVVALGEGRDAAERHADMKFKEMFARLLQELVENECLDAAQLGKILGTTSRTSFVED